MTIVQAVMRGTALLRIYADREAAQAFADQCNGVSPRGKQATVVPLEIHGADPAGKVRPGRITDEQIRAYRVAYYAQMHAGTAGPDQGNAIRAGLVAAYVRRELEQRTEPELHPINLDPYPATVGEVADEIARYVVELHESGAARHLVDEVFSRLADWRSSRDDGIAEHESNRHPDLDEIF